MYYIFRAMTPRLLQRIRAFGAISVTFFAFLGAPAVAEPALTLISICICLLSAAYVAIFSLGVERAVFFSGLLDAILSTMCMS